MILCSQYLLKGLTLIFIMTRPTTPANTTNPSPELADKEICCAPVTLSGFIIANNVLFQHYPELEPGQWAVAEYAVLYACLTNWYNF